MWRVNPGGGPPATPDFPAEGWQFVRGRWIWNARQYQAHLDRLAREAAELARMNREYAYLRRVQPSNWQYNPYTFRRTRGGRGT